MRGIGNEIKSRLEAEWKFQELFVKFSVVTFLAKLNLIEFNGSKVLGPLIHR